MRMIDRLLLSVTAATMTGVGASPTVAQGDAK